MFSLREFTARNAELVPNFPRNMISPLPLLHLIYSVEFHNVYAENVIVFRILRGSLGIIRGLDSLKEQLFSHNSVDTCSKVCRKRTHNLSNNQMAKRQSPDSKFRTVNNIRNKYIEKHIVISIDNNINEHKSQI